MDKFYKNNKTIKKAIFEAKELALNIFIERKDENYTRIKDNISFDEIIEIFEREEQKSENRMHWVFIKRSPENNPYGHIVEKEDGTFDNYTTYYEIGGCTLLLHKDYFLSIYLREEDGDKLVKKYNLKTL